MVLTGGTAWADPEQYGYGGHMMGGYGHGVLGGAVMILFWIAAIVCTVLAIRWLSQNGGNGKRSSALDILQERLARGDIDSDEYQNRKKALEG
ncbi:SHOCT domain-containing protein [Rhodobacteraceae bacterium M382]|nr:SHOCT domain-containing protein [Rhodobacteraceae bacterium M382]